MTNPHEFDWDDPLARRMLTVDCPVCGAGIGWPCTIRCGPYGRHTHLRRADRAIRKHNRETYGTQRITT